MDAHVILHILNALKENYYTQLQSILDYSILFKKNDHECQSRSKKNIKIELPNYISYKYTIIDNNILPKCINIRIKECNLSINYYKFNICYNNKDDFIITEVKDHDILCNAFDCKLEQCVKTVVFVTSDEKYYSVLLPINEHVYIPHLTKILNCDSEYIHLLPAELCEKILGFKPGFIPPFGIPVTKTIISNSLSVFDKLLFFGGKENIFGFCNINDFLKLTNSQVYLYNIV